jgi:hypothetical protein
MAQASFFVNSLEIIDKGERLILRAQRQCAHGRVIDQVFLTFPAELKRVFVAFAEQPMQDGKPPDAHAQNPWHHRLERFFGTDN